MNNTLVQNLLDNSKSAVIGAIELHNKPTFPYRYEITVILTINAWELAFKAYILKNIPDVKVIRDDGTTKPFDQCLGLLSNKLGREFLPVKESIDKLYEYRCNIIHFYGGQIELILYTLLRPNILYYSEFIKKHFDIDIADETNLILLPIGFKRTISPIDFLSKQSVEGSDAVKKFVNSIIQSTNNLIENEIQDSIIVDYRMSVVNENRVQNADIVAAITKDPTHAAVMVQKIINIGGITDDPTAQKVRIEEESLFKDVFKYSHADLVEWSKENIQNFKLSKDIKEVLRGIKDNPNYYRLRHLNPKKENSSSQGFYSLEGLEYLKKEYEKLMDLKFDDF